MANKQKKQNRALPSEKKTVRKPWSKKRKLIASVVGALAIAFIVFLTVLIVLGFGAVRPIKSSEQEATVVGSCGGYEVKYEELRYLTLLHKRVLDGEMGAYASLDEAGKEAYAKELNSRVVEDLESNYIILSLCEEYGVDTDSREVRDYVQDEIELFVSESFEGSMDKYKAWLGENALTDSFLRLNYKVDRLESLLLTHFADNKIGIAYDNGNRAEFVEYIMEGKDWVRTIHAYYPKESEYFSTKDSKTRAEAAAARLSAIADDEERYAQMKSEIGAAPFVSGFSTTGNGLYFMKGVMGELYDEASFSLEIYGTSDVVETADGYYVIMRMPLEREHLDIETVPELLTRYQYSVLKKHEDEKKAELSFAGNDYFKSLNLIEMQ